jgi:hypothetical protein
MDHDILRGFLNPPACFFCPRNSLLVGCTRIGGSLAAYFLRTLREWRRWALPPSVQRRIKIFEVNPVPDFAVFDFKYSKIFPMDIFAVPRIPIPPAGTLPRCPHSIYAPDSGKALSCGLCFPLRPPFARAVVLPPRCDHPLDHHGRLYANQKQPGTCPACSSAVHFVLDDGRWECADCRATFKAPKQKHSENAVEVAA